jgi:general secretion pathway protein C
MKLNWQWLTNLNFSNLLSQTARYRTGAILMVMTILTYQSVGIFYKALGLQLIRTKTAAPALQKAASVPVAAAEPADFYKVIAERNLFGTTDKTIAEKLSVFQTTAAQPDIATTLEVRGTVAGDSRHGFAVIEEKTHKRQKLYKVGDMVSGVKVIRIMRNAVAFMVNDQERILRIPETTEKAVLPAGTASVPASLPTAGPDSAIVVSKNDIENSLRDIGTMLSQAQVRPYFTAGRPDGFVISSIRGGSLYQRIGLVDGDIVQAVNDRKLTTGDDMMELYNLLKSSSSMALKVMRQGRQETFNYTFR